jgi:type I restriction enzyme S subunit
MRDGWVDTTFGEAFNIQQGKTLAINKLKGGKYPVYGANGVVGYFDEYNFDFPVTGLGCRGSCGTIYHINEKAFLANNVMAIWEKDSSRIESRFIPLALTNVDLVTSGAISGQVQPQITKQGLEPVPIKIPPLPEQKRIVDLISSVDSYIEALIEQLESAKRSRNAVLHELLTAGGDDWVETTLGKVCEFVNGDRGKNYPSAKFRQSHGIPFINAGHLDNGVVNFDSMDFISEEVFKKLGSGKIQSGDTLFCLRGSVGKFANVEDLKEGAIASSLVIMRPKSGITKDFLMHYLDSEMCSSEIKQSLTGAVQPNLSANNLKNFKISLPNIKSQIEIDELLGEFRFSISSMGVLIESTKDLRAGLLSDLLSGKHEIPASYDRVMGAA